MFSPITSSPRHVGTLRAIIDQRRAPIDYQRAFGDHRLAFVGETHWQPNVIDEMVRAMPSFRSSGFTHLALETVLARHDQTDLINKWRAGKVDRTHVEERIAAPAIPYMGVIEAAFEQGMEVVGVECRPFSQMPTRTMHSFGWEEEFNWEKFVAHYDAENGREQDLSLPLTFFANCYAFKVVEPILEQLETKVLFFGGGNHYGYGSSPMRQMTYLNYLFHAKMNIAGAVVYVTTGVHSAMLDEALEDKDYLSPLLLSVPAIARSAHLSEERFMIDLREYDTEEQRPDFVVHI